MSDLVKDSVWMGIPLDRVYIVRNVKIGLYLNKIDKVSHLSNLILYYL